MISKKHVKDFVREGEMEKIENYEKAVADQTQTWDCHHRLELTLEGDFAHTREDLKRMGMYYNRPYFELIFLTRAEHRRLHSGVKFSEERIKNLSKALKGRKLSEETRNKMREAQRNNPRNQFGKKYFEHFGYSKSENPRQYDKEHKWYRHNNNTCSWEVED